MAFSFSKTKIKNKPQAISINQTASNTKLSNSKSISSSPNGLNSTNFNKSSKLLYPIWLRDSPSCMKQLPGIYHGVLGQVQLQPALAMCDDGNFATGLDKLVKQNQKTDFLNRFTDTERVHQLLSTSRLSNEHLATIWAYANKTFPGQLTNREVCLALALIAIFQRLCKDGLLDQIKPGSENDPFVIVRLEKTPPVPTLYPNEANHRSSSRLPASSSVPAELGGLLIDMSDEVVGSEVVLKSVSYQTAVSKTLANPVSLLDGDTQSVVDTVRLTTVWFKCMCSMKSLFKRSFDVLNVESSRSSALEALKSHKGIAFCKNLCLCYPIAHNIAYKINEINEFEERSLGGKRSQLLGENYVRQINDLMISINEYWAVLINLFHESGCTSFIELIMDGLNRDNRTIAGETLDELLLELDTMNKPHLCSLCHTKFYLVNIGDALDNRDVCKADLDLVLGNELISNDQGEECHFYHVKCANFWLNNVPNNDNGQLPFRSLPARHDGDILKPTSNLAAQ